MLYWDMPIHPPATALPRLDIPAKGGFWRFWQRLKSKEDRRRELQRTMLLEHLDEDERLARMRTLVDLGLWGDHYSDEDLKQRSQWRIPSTLTEAVAEIFSLFEDTSWIYRDRRKFNEEQRSLGSHILFALNNRRCSPGLVHLAIEAGVSPNWREQNNYDDSLLTMFARKHKPEHFAVVLKAGADPSKRDSCRSTALHILIERMSHDEIGREAMEMADALIAAGVDPDSTGRPRKMEIKHPHGRYPLQVAMESNCTVAVDWLLAHGASANIQAENGENAAHWALDGSSSESVINMLQKIKELGVNLDQADERGMTPFWNALLCGHLGAALWLAEQGARLDVAVQRNSDNENNSKRGHGKYALELLIDHFSVNDESIALQEKIQSQHLDCWQWPADEGDGLTLNEKVRATRPEWRTIVERNHLLANTATAPTTAKTAWRL